MLNVDISAKSPFEGDAACVSGDVSSPVSLLAVGEADGLTSRSASDLDSRSDLPCSTDDLARPLLCHD